MTVAIGSLYCYCIYIVVNVDIYCCYCVLNIYVMVCIYTVLYLGTVVSIDCCL